MKIRLLIAPPVEKRHGLTAGRVLEVERERRPDDSSPARWFVRGDTGESVGILQHEAEIVTEGESE